MSQPPSSTTSTSVSVVTKLEIIRFISGVHSNQKAAIRFYADAMTMKQTVIIRTRLKKVRNVSEKQC